MTLFAAPALPLHKAGPYVAAAYIVFVLLVLVYVAILALRTSRIERDLAALRKQADAASGDAEPESESRDRVAV